jgi:hypothetical protein
MWISGLESECPVGQEGQCKKEKEVNEFVLLKYAKAGKIFRRYGGPNENEEGT